MLKIVPDSVANVPKFTMHMLVTKVQKFVTALVTRTHTTFMYCAIK